MAKGEKTTGGASRMTRIVLVISLALNLAVIGLVVGAAVSGRLGKGPPRSFDMGLGPVAKAFEPEERRRIASALRQNGALRDLDLRSRVVQMVVVLRQDPFDRNALGDLLLEQNAGVEQLRNAAQEVVLDQIAAMTPDRRAAFADRLQEELMKNRGPRPSGG